MLYAARLIIHTQLEVISSGSNNAIVVGTKYLANQLTLCIVSIAPGEFIVSLFARQF